MRTPDEAAAMLRLKGLGWGTADCGGVRLQPGHVRRYWKAGGWRRTAPRGGRRRLDGREDFLAERFRRHRGNADVVRQDLARELGVTVSLRTVERAVAPFRRALRAEARACMRFETPPGKQLQIDFGESRVAIGGEIVRVYLFVATLGYSRRIFVQAFRHERQSAWFDGIEAAFRTSAGCPQEVLFDNARALVDYHDAATREVRFNARLLAFARYWGFRPRACAPYRARTKGKDERGVGYVKRNAIAGHGFDSWAALEAHLVVVDARDRRRCACTARRTRRRSSALRARRGGGAAPARRPAAVPAGARTRPPGADRLHHRARRQQLLGAVAADRRERRGRGRRAAGCASATPGARSRCIAETHRPASARDRSGPLRRRRRRRRGRRAATQARRRRSRRRRLLRPLAEYERLVGGGW